MAPLTTLKLASRSPKKPIKKLPPTIQLAPDTSVEDVKKQVAKAINLGDHNRIGLFDPSTKKTLKDRKALIASLNIDEVLVKDLGPQISWKTVFLIEYFGPILIHVAVLAARPYIYKGSPAPTDLSRTQWLAFGMITLHFVKRELETMFVHKFSASTMPFFNVFKNSFFYWAFSGLLCAYCLYSPTSLAAKAREPSVDVVGALIYLFGETGNARVHYYLSTLRSAGGTERKIPVGHGFGLVTCPNYMFEVLSWVGIIVASRDWSVILFIAIGTAQMAAWAKGKERAYRKEFGDSYKKKRFTMLPGLF
ncbi:very-long-chain enoyl-CoA reductase [Geosmithia morbida]|uniref:very-long-chain enoyl-CoA reductase n=1 Tax=Geosmithia morbida TaxID=1094350 RepID=A0A9P4YXS6_9HYPO|nr:very-long-chain enoyl-CoA reductase [Geosmithia morbida]KAF4123643.1 very-long-chain enoyl-CoA reductase [Geosmithia morbida]